MRIAIFPGTFDPYTIGHHSLAERATELFDKLVIAIGYNEQKPESKTSAQSRLKTIQEIYNDNPKIDVITYSGLTVECAKRIGAKFILRGVRSTIDFEYERTMADINRRLSGIETILLYSLPEDACISSSIVRELQHNGVDISKFLPSASDKE